jgi:hypothetical protein
MAEAVNPQPFGENLIEGVIISGTSVMHERIKNGAAILSF